MNIELGQYTGLKVKKPTSYTVTDKDVDDYLAEQVEKFGRKVMAPAGRLIRSGDVALIDYSGSIDGVKFEGGTAKNQELEIGSGTFIPGFEDQLIGRVVGDAIDVRVDFPKDYHAEKLAGKAAIFAVEIKNIFLKETPEVDDKFASEVSDFDNLADFKKAVKKSLTELADNANKIDTEIAIIEAVVLNTKIDVPKDLVQKEIDRKLKQIEQQLTHEGLTLADFCKFTGETIEGLQSGYYDVACKIVKTNLVLEAIRVKEDIEGVTNEEMLENVTKFLMKKNTLI